MQDRLFKYHFTTSSRTARFGADWKRLSDRDFRNRPEPLDRLIAIPDEPKLYWAQDLWRVGRATYLADRRSPRSSTSDGWTRTIELSVQVSEPENWSTESCAVLSELLRVLTGDRWDIRIHAGAETIGALLSESQVLSRPITEVALFSGGLDSTAYAAGRARELGEYDRLLLVAFEQPVLHRPQQRIHSAIERLAHDSRHSRPYEIKLPLEQLPMTPRSRGRLDHSNRSRSLLFITSAVCLAAIHGVRTVAVPENGQLAINPPLTPARRSACSTRSVHPWILDMLNALISAIGGDVTVQNPFLHLTKGEVCRHALRAGLEWETLERTISCGHPTRARSKGRTEYHCGHCFPCLVRRSGMHAASGRRIDESGYRLDPSAMDLRSELAADLRDLR